MLTLIWTLGRNENLPIRRDYAPELSFRKRLKVCELLGTRFHAVVSNLNKIVPNICTVLKKIASHNFHFLKYTQPMGIFDVLNFRRSDLSIDAINISRTRLNSS